MLRTLIWFAYFWISLVIYLPAMFKLKNLSDAEKRTFADEKAREWAGRLLKLAGCSVELKGENLIPKDETVLYVCNHQSNFDIPLTICYLPKTKGFIAKVEMLKMPLVRTWMKYLSCVFMDRDDPRQQVKSISAGIEILKSGQSMVIFPEGTRSRDGSVKEFKAGGLKLATKSGVTIVPVTIKGAIHLMEKGSWIIKPAKVEIIISEPIYITAEMNRETIQLSERVKDCIESKLY